MIRDAELVQGFRRRNSRSLEKAIAAYGKVVYALCARILTGLGKPEDVEECVSDTFLAVWARIGEFRPERGPFRTWILMLGKYKALDARRRLIRNREEAGAVDPGVPDPRAESALTDVENRQLLSDTLQSLEVLDRELVYRRYYLYESVERLAADYRLTPRAVHNRLWRARKVLREKLSRAGAEEGVR
ncbi:MAG: sigma-70 family RNA polymerase sigma factor [Candidatus Desulforudis sp.]|nr:sigma-70 family RNA polymerase sigma factor [Desulforudis sp.]